jgi:non-ribosomal peptide synthetase component F
VVEVVQPRRQVDRNPIFQIMFNFLNQPSRQFELNDLSIEWMDNVDTDSKFDITCYLLEEGNTITCTIDFAKALFKKERIIQMSRHYANILELISHSPWIPLSSIDFSSANEVQDQQRQMDAFFS